jgi:hypothetical protein
MQSMNQASNRKDQSENQHSKIRMVKDQSRVNMRGDVYAMNTAGQVTAFRFSNTEMMYSFVYDDKGDLSGISSSAGWTWTKTDADGFRGWVIRNYFDRWQVNEEDTGSVFVNHTGIHATGKQAELMALPEVGLG